MKTILLLTVSAVGSILLSWGFFNQNKSTNNLPTTSEKMAFLTNCKWQMSDETTFADGRTTQTFKDYKSCIKDDIMTFYANGCITINENKDKCNATAPQTNNGVWAFDVKNKNILDIAVTMDISAEIVELTPTKLVWKYQNGVGDIVTQTFTKG
jgi:hypothetical protein